ncbi:MAG: FAD-binding protein [Oscillospiraceae bacterium]
MVINTNFEVHTAAGDTIPGLYAIGEIAFERERRRYHSGYAADVGDFFRPFAWPATDGEVTSISQGRA